MSLTPLAVRRVRGLIRKEFLQIIRDPSSILIAFILPLSLLFIFGYGVSLDISRTNVGIALERVTPEAVSFLQSFTGSRYFNVKLSHDPRPLQDDLVAGRIRGLIVLPVDFSTRLLNRDRTAPVQVITDGSEPNTANFVENYTQATWNLWMASRQQNGGLVSANSRVWFNQELESRNTLLPGALPIIVTLVGTLLTTLVVAREWDRGTMEALISTPVTIEEILISKFIPYFVLGMGTLYFCVFIVHFWFQVPFRGSFIVLTLSGALFLLNALGVGLLISTATKNQFAASQAALFSAFLPAFLLSGYIYEISSMPWFIQQITALMPARYFVTSLRTIMLAGDIWSVLLPSFGAMLAIACMLYLAIASKTVKRLE